MKLNPTSGLEVGRQ